MQIDLTSSQDTVLYLLNGANSRGTIVTSDDDGGSGNNSRITTVLEAGTYTAEATTHDSRVTGDFTLSIYASTAPRNCFQHLGGGCRTVGRTCPGLGIVLVRLPTAMAGTVASTPLPCPSAPKCRLT